jgi:sn-glycerol 3-phosphate transport system substrate-binding protein
VSRSRHLAVGIVLLASILAGCSGGGRATSTGPQNGSSATTTVDPGLCPVKALATVSAPVQLTFWHSMTSANEQALKTLTDKYNASQTKVHVNLTFQGTYDESLQKYVTAVRGGDLPNIIQTEETAVQTMMDSKSIVPIGACVVADGYDMSDYAPSLAGQYSFGGVLQAMPFQVSNPILYYNKKAFRAAGLDPEKPPTTLDQIVDDSRKIVATGKAKGATDKAFALQIQG